MKIVLITGIFPPDIGGPATYCRHLADTYTRQGVQVVVLAYGSGCVHSEYPVIRISRRWPPIIRQKIMALCALWQLRNADAVIAFDALGAGLPAAIAAFIWRVPLAIRLGGDFIWERYVERTGELLTLREFYASARSLTWRDALDRRLMKLGFHVARSVVFSTRFQRDIFIHHYDIPEAKTAVIGNYFMPELATPIATGNRILWAGRFLKLKNISMLLNVFQKLAAQHPEAQLILVGDGPEKTALHNTVRALHLEERVRFQPVATSADMGQLLATARYVIVPSLTDVSPNLALESAMRGVPVIVTTETGLTEMMPELLYAHPKDDDDWFLKMRSLLDDATREEYCERLRHIAYRASWAQLAGAYLNLLDLHNR